MVVLQLQESFANKQAHHAKTSASLLVCTQNVKVFKEINNMIDKQGVALVQTTLRVGHCILIILRNQKKAKMKCKMIRQL